MTRQKRPDISPATTLILLGTIHSDPLGFKRTTKFLEALRPDLILVELSEFALNYRIERGPHLRKLLLQRLQTLSHDLGIEYRVALKNWRIAAILRQISLPFEYRASVAFAGRTGAEVIPIDYSEFSREWVETWQEMISVENIRQLLEMQTEPPPIALQYKEAARKIACGIANPELLAWSDASQWQQRENHLAVEILRAHELFKPNQPIYIGGWRHLLPGERIRTIRDILGIKDSACFLLGQNLFPL
ncbi:MAG: hypothetical protein AB9866_28170 [Syntrophobacteraceae bacterium]